MNNINIALAYINGTENPLKVFCNLFIYVLNKADNQKLRIDEVKEALTKEFGLKVPNHIIKACARVLKNNNEVQILNSGEGYKFLKSNFDIKKFSDELLQRKIREEMVLEYK
jgi:argonaute-like protein implicated in RNA metabolism and viral defense